MWRAFIIGVLESETLMELDQKIQEILVYYAQKMEDADLPPLRMYLDALQYEIIVVTMEMCDNVANRAAKYLNLNRSTLVEKTSILERKRPLMDWVHIHGFFQERYQKEILHNEYHLGPYPP